MEDIISTRSAELFASRRIIEMLENGVDLKDVAKLSERSSDKCIELIKNIDNDNNSNLSAFFTNESNNNKIIKVKKKGYLECPYCGELIKGISDEWVLLQFENDEKKYLSCRKCKGKNVKNNI